MVINLINLLGISIVSTSPFVITVVNTGFRVWASNWISIQHTSNHTRHNHDENWKDFQETSQNWASLGMDVVLGTKSSLNNHLGKNYKKKKKLNLIITTSRNVLVLINCRRPEETAFLTYRLLGINRTYAATFVWTSPQNEWHALNTIRSLTFRTNFYYL